MGLEATCAATLDGETSRGKALLETTEVIFRGDFRARVPLAARSKRVTVAGDTLTLKWRGGTLALELGAAAPQVGREDPQPAEPPRQARRQARVRASRSWVTSASTPPSRASSRQAAPTTRRRPRGRPSTSSSTRPTTRADLARIAALAQAPRSRRRALDRAPQGQGHARHRERHAQGRTRRRASSTSRWRRSRPRTRR